MRLSKFAKNVYSQNGEDGILQKILETLHSRDHWCVEFGAWDGQHLSNTCNLIEHAGYSAVLIEGSKARFGDLLERYGHKKQVIPLNQFVGFTAEDGLDSILRETPIPKDFDLLSVDIDGNDFHVWNAVSEYQPKVVCIEYNPTIPTEIDFVQKADQKVSHGSSLTAFCRLGKTKGYELVATTNRNAFFVRAKDFSRFEIADNHPRVVREDVSEITHIFAGYDGTIFVRGGDQIIWHRLKFSNRLRQVPWVFRGFPDDFGPVKDFLYKVYRRICMAFGRG